MVGQSAMADRSAPASPDARRSSKAIWLQTAYRQSEGEDLRAKLGARVRDRRKGKIECDSVGLRHKAESEIPGRGLAAVEHAVRVDKSLIWDLGIRISDFFVSLRLCVNTHRWVRSRLIHEGAFTQRRKE